MFIPGQAEAQAQGRDCAPAVGGTSAGTQTGLYSPRGSGVLPAGGIRIMETVRVPQYCPFLLKRPMPRQDARFLKQNLWVEKGRVRGKRLSSPRCACEGMRGFTGFRDQAACGLGHRCEILQRFLIPSLGA